MESVCKVSWEEIISISIISARSFVLWLRQVRVSAAQLGFPAGRCRC